MNAKPKREDFRTDDEFGEAYGHWMASKPKMTSRPAPQTPQPSRPQPIARPAQVLVNAARTPMSARFEADRDTWNHSTKARFRREAANAAAKEALGKK